MTKQHDALLPDEIWAGIDKLEMFPYVWETKPEEGFAKYIRADRAHPVTPEELNVAIEYIDRCQSNLEDLSGVGGSGEDDNYSKIHEEINVCETIRNCLEAIAGGGERK